MSDNSIDSYVPTSRLRRALAFYLNLIIGVTVIGVLLEFVPVPEDRKFIVRWSLALVFAALDELLLGKTPGHMILSITPYGVPNSVFVRETYLGMFLGVICILDGCKRAVLWTQYQLPEPIMGRIAEGIQLGAYNMALGLLFIAAGVLILRLHKFGWILALCGIGVHALSVITSWELWDGYVAELVTRRRELQGIPVRPNEIEFMQMLMPEGVMVGFAIAAILLFATYRKIFNKGA